MLLFFRDLLVVFFGMDHGRVPFQKGSMCHQIRSSTICLETALFFHIANLFRYSSTP